MNHFLLARNLSTSYSKWQYIYEYRLLRGNIWKREKSGFFNYYEAMKLDLKN